jgi:hypothetical protein
MAITADLSPADIDPELTKRLGQIVIRWSTVEAWIASILANATNADPGAMQVVTANVSTSTQIQWIKTLLSVHEHKDPELSEVTALLNRADEIRADRNALVHGIWNPAGCEPGTCLINTARLERSEIIRNSLVTIADLDELRDRIDEWIAEFIELGKRIGFPRKYGETKSIFAD